MRHHPKKLQKLPQKKGDGPEERKRGTVLEREKKGDGPGEEKRGTVLEREKGGRSWREKKGDGPGEKKRGTVLEKKMRTVPKFILKIM